MKTNEGQEIIKFVKVLLVVVVCILAIYFFTRAFVTKDLFNKKEEETKEATKATIDYSITTLGSVFNRPYEEYYVMAYDYKENDAAYYATIASAYLKGSDVTKLYFVDLDDIANKSFVSKESNPAATKASELKVSGPTLIKIKNGKIVKYLETKEEITSEIKVES